MSAVSSAKGRRSDPLQKRIPVNPKFRHVKSTLDTGASLSRYMAKIDHIRENYKFKKNEIFKRMKVTTLVQLIIQVQRVCSEDIYDDIPPTPASLATNVDADREEEGCGDRGDESPVPSLAVTEGDYGSHSEIQTQRSTLLSVSRGIGEMDLNEPPPAPDDKFVDDSSPYLLLDIRDKDEFDRCHLITAISYPKATLSRAANYESKEMLRYKNKAGKIIIIYDEDERICHEAATTLVQRNYDNLFMLSGGLKVALQKFPESLATGTPPDNLLPAKARGRPLPALQKHFTLEDIDNLEFYLDDALQDHSCGSRLSKTSTASSRMSKASTARSTTSMYSQSSALAGRPAFKPP